MVYVLIPKEDGGETFMVSCADKVELEKMLNLDYHEYKTYAFTSNEVRAIVESNFAVVTI